ncbi:hypothetical protein L1276_000714 [Flavobacterium sp. HSC-32F16]|nr:hypothetical protein [Flavobacterium sp. HSC-32F16]
MYDTRFLMYDTDKMPSLPECVNLHYRQKYNFSDKLSKNKKAVKN